MFLTFLALLVAGAAVPVVLFSSVEILGLTGLTPLRLASGPGSVRRAAFGAWSLAQTYIWLGWAAYCASLGLGYALDPAAGNPWTYVSVSLFATGLPIAYLRVKDRLTSGADAEDQHLLQGSNFWRIVVLSGCICFWVAPQLISTPYGWLYPVAPKVLAGIHQDATGAVGAAPARATTSAPLPEAKHSWLGAVAHAKLSLNAGPRTGRSAVTATSSCPDDQTGGNDQGEGGETAESQEGCGSDPGDAVPTDNQRRSQTGG